MKFRNWTLKDLERWAALLPSASLINSDNKIKIWGEIHVENWEPKNEENNDETN